MKHIICIFGLLFTSLTTCYLSAQKDSLEDLIIEIPIKIDIIYDEIYIDSTKFEKIKQDNKWCSFSVIENLDRSLQSFQNKKDQPSFTPLPFLSKMKDTLAIIISDKSKEKESKLIILLGLNDENELRCFYKSSSDKKYKNFVFYDNEQYVPLKFILRKRPYSYVLWNPFFDKKEDKILGFIRKKEISRFQFLLTFGIHNGVSSLKFKPDTSQNINSIYYEAKVVNSFNIKVQALYSVKNLLLGLYAGYENNNDENNTRIINSRQSGSTINLNYSGNGNWPNQLFHIGIIGSYDILVSNYLIISPNLYSGIYTYYRPKPFDTGLGGNNMKEFKKKYSLGGGLYLKIPINENFWFTTGLIYQFNHFDASSYFTDIKKATYSSRQEILRIELGTCLKF